MAPSLPGFDMVDVIAMRGSGCLLIGKKFCGHPVTESIDKKMKNNYFEARDLLVYVTIHTTFSMIVILILGTFATIQ